MTEDFTRRTDRLGPYLKKHLESLVFDELSEAYLKREGLSEILAGVPVPFRGEDLAAFQTEGLRVIDVAKNMARVMGADPQFPYVQNYKAYMEKYFNEKLTDAMVGEGQELLEEGKGQEGVILFRAALCLSPEDLHAMYGYARGLRELYLAGEEKEEEYDRDYAEYIAACKAEATEYFERITEVHPEFAQSYYFLGYAYLNLGLYRKAALTFEEFLKRSDDPEDRKEIRERLNQLEEPVRIEEGVNEILAGRWQKGITILEPFEESSFQDWWPLHYYLGAAYDRIGKGEKALASYLRVLRLNPSHVETMEELARLYGERGEAAASEKYHRKALLVREQLGDDSSEI